MAVKNGELDYTFKKIIDTHVYHFEIVLRDCDSLDNHIIGWAIINTKTDESIFKISKYMEKLTTQNDIDVFKNKIILSAKEISTLIV